MRRCHHTFSQHHPNAVSLSQASPLSTCPSGLGWISSALGALCPLPGHGQSGEVEWRSFQGSSLARPR